MADQPKGSSTIIAVRYANNTYHAKAPGSKLTATCTAGRQQAAEALARKLGIDPGRLLNESSDGNRFEFSTVTEARA